MTQPIALGRSHLFPSPPDLDWGANALSAPTTPDKRLPVIDKSKVDPEIVKAAEGMETLFLNEMMKAMRQTVPKNEMDLESPATGIYRSMLDNEYAQKAAHTGGIGLADQIIAYLESQRYNLKRGFPEPLSQGQDLGAKTRTGGAHEGQPVR